MERKYRTGQRLVVELTTGEVLEGDFVSGSKQRLELNNICYYGGAKGLGASVMTYYANEINSINELSVADGDDNDKLEPEKPPQTGNYIKMPPDEYGRLKELVESYEYITMTDKAYHDAVERLRSSETIGVAALCADERRKCDVDLLVFSTWDRVYIFDVRLFRKAEVPDDIRAIVHCADIRKVAHDSRFLVDCFLHRYHTKVVNLFDTQVADVRLQRADHPSKTVDRDNLSSCLVKHFNFPYNLLKKAMSPDVRWNKRPLDDATKTAAAQLAVYLIPLKNHLERLLLADFYRDVDEFSRSTVGLTAVEARAVFRSSKQPPVVNGNANA